MSRIYDPVRIFREIEKILALEDGTAKKTEKVANIRSYVIGMEKGGVKPDDPVREFASLAADQWSSMILFILKDGPFRYSILHKLVGAVSHTRSISQRILTLKLKKLQFNGLVTRTMERDKPMLVMYGLSTLGHDFVREIEGRAAWVITRIPEIMAARIDTKNEDV